MKKLKENNYTIGWICDLKEDRRQNKKKYGKQELNEEKGDQVKVDRWSIESGKTKETNFGGNEDHGKKFGRE